MDYHAALVEAGRIHGEAASAMTATEAHRDYMIRAAHVHGHLTVREIAGAVGISHQRVGQIVAESK